MGGVEGLKEQSGEWSGLEGEVLGLRVDKPWSLRQSLGSKRGYNLIEVS